MKKNHCDTLAVNGSSSALINSIKKRNLNKCRVVYDGTRGLSDVIDNPSDTIISGGDNCVRNSVLAQIICAYGVCCPTIIFHNGNHILEEKLVLSTYAQKKGGVVQDAIEPFGSLNSDEISKILTVFMEKLGGIGFVNDCLDFIYKSLCQLTDDVVDLRSLFELSQIPPPKTLIALHEKGLISKEKFHEERERISCLSSEDYKLMKNYIKRLTDVFDITPKGSSRSLYNILRNNQIICIDLKNNSQNKLLLLDFLLELIPVVSMKTGKEPLIVFDSVTSSFSDVFRRFVSAPCTLKVVSGQDLTVFKDDIITLFSSGKHMIFLQHSNNAADRAASIIGTYDKIQIEADSHKNKNDVDIFGNTGHGIVLRTDYNAPRIDASTIRSLDFTEAIISPNGKDKTIITNVVRTV